MSLPPPDRDRIAVLPPSGIDRLLAIMAALRDPRTGCPWDIEQSFATIAPYTLEEAHEVADAIDRQAWGELKGELGDLLFQTVYHARMADEAGHFSFADVVETISAKMIARHPHVFGPESRDKTPEQQTRDWEAQKAAERGSARTLDGIAASLPALTRALKLQGRAARVGFDWPSTTEVLDKLVEEAREVVEARDTLTHAALTEEIGDLLFVMANLARHLKVDPEAALRAANRKFTRRFARIEDWLAETGSTPADSDLAEMDALWNRAKAEDKAEVKAEDKAEDKAEVKANPRPA
ncbi:MAG: nucleoside triphosphate pyrophosphohydrolase [Rhodobacteraceae bacterium]|nr:nucleoside triphosphate pyrophosphohydrolase [Paracoccaceae bacterium]